MCQDRYGNSSRAEREGKLFGLKKTLEIVSKTTLFYAATQRRSSLCLVFFNLTSQLKRTDVIAFCMQLGNSDDR